MEGVKNRALTIREMGRATAGMAVPKRQLAASDHPSAEFEPRLKLEDWVHQQPVRRLVIPCPVAAKTGRNQQDIGRAQDLATEERLMKKGRDADDQNRAEGEDLAARSHGAMPPCMGVDALGGYDRFKN